MRVLAVADMRHGRNAASLVEGLIRLGHEVRSVDIGATVSPRIGSGDWLSIRRHGALTASTQSLINDRIAEAVECWRPHVTVAVKAIHLDQDGLFQGEPSRAIHISFDDVSNPDNISEAYLEHESRWDIIVTTKSYNVPEIRERGGEPFFIWGAYDPRTRRNIRDFADREFGLGFIGAARPDRIDLPREMSKNCHSPALVVGPRWRRRYPFGVSNVNLLAEAVGEGYTAVANQIRVGLVLLNSENRDLHTNRSFETPATGQLVLAERTPEHEQLFDDGVDALLFGSRTELWEKFAMARDDSACAARIAEAGRLRVESHRNTWFDRASEIVERAT